MSIVLWCMRQKVKRKYYAYGEEHHAWKKERNLALVKDRYPHWPATGTKGLSIKDITVKYKIVHSRVFQIIRNMKIKEFGYAE